MYLIIKRLKLDTMNDIYTVAETSETLERAQIKKDALNVLAEKNESFSIFEFIKDEKPVYTDNVKQLKFPFAEA